MSLFSKFTQQNTSQETVKNREVTVKGKRMYAGARQSRLTENWSVIDSSADLELVTSLTALRARSRQLVRDAPFAKRAKRVIQNNVIGQGVGLQGKIKTTRGQLASNINDDIESQHKIWCKADSCHTGGSLHFHDMERLILGEVFEAGEVLIRKHPKRFGNSKVPLALEIIEAERLVSDFSVPGPVNSGNTVRMGIEVDKFNRPVGYWLRPFQFGDARFQQDASNNFLEYVPASDIIHLRIIDRWPQTRGEPWLSATLRKLNDVDGYTEAEIIAARGSAMYMGIIESPFEQGQQTGDGTDTNYGDGMGAQQELSPGILFHTEPGEKFTPFAPNRPNSGAEPFLRFMLREIASGTGVSYESLTRDYSQSNYSSSRLALLDDRDLWRILQLWYIRSFREPLYGTWLQQAVFSRAVSTISVDQYASNTEKYNAVHYKPRGWTWVDPAREIAAYQMAVQSGFTTVSDVISQTGNGRDIEDILDEREEELEMMKEKGLSFSTDPGVMSSGSNMQGQQNMKTPATSQPNDDSGPDEADQEDATQEPGRSSVNLTYLSGRQ